MKSGRKGKGHDSKLRLAKRRAVETTRKIVVDRKKRQDDQLEYDPV
jgi:hypothetical protein